LFSNNFYINNLIKKNQKIKDSPLKTLINQNQIITNVANCKVTSAYTFYECLYKFDLNPNIGYCVSSSEIYDLSQELSKF
jgi:hypothetical protein